MHLWSFAAGNVLNELTAACWFTYLLVFLKEVPKLSAAEAGTIVLVGQLVDAAATPLIGLLSDAKGRRKLFHFLGSILVGTSFVVLFSRSLTLLGYCLCVALFNIGWAAAQVTHLALIPEQSLWTDERARITAARYSFAVLSNMAVFGILAVLIWAFQNAKQEYFWLSIIVVLVGGVGLSLFYSRISERTYPLTDDLIEWREWFERSDFYQVAFTYMCVRLTVNISQAYIPLYVKALNMSNEAITLVPLTLYTSSLIGSICRSIPLTYGALICMFALASLDVLNESSAFIIYPIVVLLGFGNTTLMVSMVSIVSDLIGIHTESGAFVFGALSFTDKLSNGLVIYALQKQKDIRLAVSIIPAMAAAFCVIMSLVVQVRENYRILY